MLLIYIFIPAFHERETLAPLWKMFTFTQNYGQDIRRYGTFSHAWSLCVEEQFYLLLAADIDVGVFLQAEKKIRLADTRYFFTDHVSPGGLHGRFF